MTREGTFAILYHGRIGDSYFDRMTSIGPKFGAGPDKAQRFRTRDEAELTMQLWPLAAEAMCEVVELAKGGDE